MGKLQDQRQLIAAKRCVEAILAAGTTKLSVEELREAAQVSKRTFHRYFPYKAQAIRPYFAAMTAELSTLLARNRPLSVERIADAWFGTVLGTESSQTLELIRLLRTDQEFWSVFLEVIEDSEREFAGALRARNRPAPGSSATARIDAEVTAISLAASSRLALAAAIDRDEDPAEAFATYLRAFSPPLL